MRLILRTICIGCRAWKAMADSQSTPSIAVHTTPDSSCAALLQRSFIACSTLSMPSICGIAIDTHFWRRSAVYSKRCARRTTRAGFNPRSPRIDVMQDVEEGEFRQAPSRPYRLGADRLHVPRRALELTLAVLRNAGHLECC